VAGWAALYLEKNPTASPAQVKAALEASATSGAVTYGDSAAGTPNLMVYVPGAALKAAGGGSGGGGAAAVVGTYEG
jgi:hypothetical protein